MATTGQGRRVSVTVVPNTDSPLRDAFRFDLTRSMSISYSGTPTPHPVQTGAEGPTDMIVIDPPSVSITGVTANTPVQPLAGLSDFLIQALELNTDRMVTLTELIAALHRQKILCTVFCSWHRPLRNRWPMTVDLSRDQSSGNTINTAVQFAKIRQVTSETVPVLQDSDVQALAQSRVEFGPVGIE